MSNRFAAGLKELKTAAPKPAIIEPEAEIRTQGASVVPPSRKGKVIISAYFDPAVRQQFAILAVKQNRSQAALLAEALNMVFEKYGEPPIARA
ncbi:MAG TPA: ribbon-helix-helix domain-containing protein [Microvirga sp.]|nr:ribbon-helix-helix domain-containing protein [Microvirga sp.]